jgi:hypothetical protein
MRHPVFGLLGLVAYPRSTAPVERRPQNAPGDTAQVVEKAAFACQVWGAWPISRWEGVRVRRTGISDRWACATIPGGPRGVEVAWIAVGITR